MSSFREINYALRPAKAVERKMMIEAFRCLSLGWALAEYRYVGMGSVYFADFQLMHQSLGISDMISLEKSLGDKHRCDFNKPYKCIEVKPGNSGELLPKLPWDKKSIIWLDYDGEMDASVIADVRSCAQNALSGSVLVVSVNIETKSAPQELANADEKNAWRLNEFTERVGKDSVPAGVTGAVLRGPGGAKVCWQILHATIENQLVAKNGRSDVRPDTLHFRQIFNFQYADGASMLTIGWCFFTESDKTKYDNCRMDKLPFSRTNEHSFLILAPKLTPKEIRHLNAALPEGTGLTDLSINSLASQTGVPKIDIQRFAEVYRFYPQYAEITL